MIPVRQVSEDVVEESRSSHHEVGLGHAPESPPPAAGEYDDVEDHASAPSV